MDFRTGAILGSLLAKDYAEDVFDLLVNYRSISSSEVAARLNLHIKTAQDFLEGLVSLGILSKEEILEKKRPYYRYTLEQDRILLDIDLTRIKRTPTDDNLSLLIRERESSGARFSTARSEDSISSVTIWTGSGREREERRIKVTSPQGKFLYHLPFPKAEFLSVADIMHKAGVEQEFAPEIMDIVDILLRYQVIESRAA
jgi:predicted transcriptional regulator